MRVPRRHLVTGSTESEHLNNLEQVLHRLQIAGMRLKKQKCAYLLPSVSYLGPVISVDASKSESSSTGELKNVGSFLGMVDYYGRFLPGLATTLTLLYSYSISPQLGDGGSSRRRLFVTLIMTYYSRTESSRI